MAICVHIGNEKTGTTTIQRFIDLNRRLISDAGYCFPASPGKVHHAKLAAYAENIKKKSDLKPKYGLLAREDHEAFRLNLERELSDEIATQPHVLISSEHLSARLNSVAEIRRLRDLLCRFQEDIRVIVYLRRQDEFLLSKYSTAVKCGESKPLVIPKPGTVAIRYDYWNILGMWAEVFGKESLTVRVFERGQMRNGDPVDDFMALIGIDDLTGWKRPGRQNESLDVRTLELLRVMNRHLPLYVDNQKNPDRGNIGRMLEKLSTGPKPTLPDDMLQEFMSQFEEGNSRVAREYLGRDDGILFAEPFASEDRAPLARLTVEEAVELFAELWRRKQRKASGLGALFQKS